LRFDDLGGHKTGPPRPSQQFRYYSSKKNPNLESNVLEHHLVETRVSNGHPMEHPQNILANDFRGCLSKLNY